MRCCWQSNTDPRYTRLSCLNFRLVMSPWSRTIFLICSGGISSFWASMKPNLRFSLYLLVCSCCHFRATQKSEYLGFLVDGNWWYEPGRTERWWKEDNTFFLKLFFSQLGWCFSSCYRLWWSHERHLSTLLHHRHLLWHPTHEIHWPTVPDIEWVRHPGLQQIKNCGHKLKYKTKIIRNATC